jgi:hypothetical protein
VGADGGGSSRERTSTTGGAVNTALASTVVMIRSKIGENRMANAGG